MKNILFLLILFAFLGCSSDDNSTPTTENKEARYKVVVTMNWSSTNFPTDYPNRAHFSRLIGWTHKTNSTFFKVGTTVFAGIKNMAETGGISPLNTEINAKIANNEGLQLVTGSSLSSGTGTIEVEIKVNKENPSVTLATMIAPSPDWYVAIVNENLLENGDFVASKTVNASAYDAGTDSGVNYTSANATTNPQGTIQKITTSPLDGNVAIATVTFTKL